MVRGGLYHPDALASPETGAEAPPPHPLRTGPAGIRAVLPTDHLAPTRARLPYRRLHPPDPGTRHAGTGRPTLVTRHLPARVHGPVHRQGARHRPRPGRAPRAAHPLLAAAAAVVGRCL